MELMAEREGSGRERAVGGQREGEGWENRERERDFAT